TAAETIGVEGRGRFYERTGVLRDIVQNHLLQVLAICAMEPPVSFTADDIRDAKLRVLRTLRPFAGAEDVARRAVRAQYGGYRGEPDVAPDSRTPTFTALKVLIDDWRWQGVPFYLRAGKRMKCRLTEIAVHFQTIPLCLFGREEVCRMLEPNVLRIRIQPDEGISLRFAAKVPGDDLIGGSVTMDFAYADAFARPLSEAYERLILDAMRGDATLFARRDEIEQAWRFVTPVLDAWDADRAAPLPEYEAGSAGPVEAERLLWKDGRRWSALA
ncbi:MAG: glucose-6-phosphate dehydrogenase, partial [Planctomycetes bacterium]|nr:glucose-6-phosphate dehydrogenase [Planctomycetota bacterium]